MTLEQVKYIKEQARKIREHAQLIVNYMSEIESSPQSSLQKESIAHALFKYTDRGYVLVDNMNAIDDIVDGMILLLEGL